MVIVFLMTAVAVAAMIFEVGSARADFDQRNGQSTPQSAPTDHPIATIYAPAGTSPAEAIAQLCANLAKELARKYPEGNVAASDTTSKFMERLRCRNH
jgi:hypothetical protein